MSNIGWDIYCHENKLESLNGIHKILNKMNGFFYVTGNPIKSHVLGLLKVQGCKKVYLDNHQVQDILNKYLPNTRGDKAVIECGFELQDAGFDEYARI